MKNNKKAFTLTELLAVIVIISLISLITIPIVLNIVEKSRKGAFTRSAENVFKTSDLFYNDNYINITNTGNIRFECKNRQCLSEVLDENEKPLKLNTTGDMGEGYVLINKEGEIEFKLQKGKYCAAKSRIANEVSVTENDCDSIDVEIDNTPPIITDVSTSSIFNSIEISVIASDPDSKITGYQYSIDNGITYTEIQKNNVYKFENLIFGETYTIRVKAYNKTYGLDGATKDMYVTESGPIQVTLPLINVPSIIVTPAGDKWSQTKTISFENQDLENINNQGYKIKYKEVDSENFNEYTEALTYNKDTIVIFQIYYNEVAASSAETVIINKIDDKEPSVTITYTKEDENEYVVGNWSDQNIIVTVEAEDKNIDGSLGSGIKKYEIIYDGQIVESNKVTINKEGTTLLKVKVTDGVDRILETEDVEIKIDKGIPTVAYSIPGGSYNEYKTIKVIGNDTNYSNMAVRVFSGKALDYSNQILEKSNDAIANGIFDVVLDTDGIYTVYADIIDLTGKSENQTPNNGGGWYYQEYIIDTTDPIVTIGVSSSTTNSITLPYTVTDTMSEITSKTCKYGTEYLKYTETGSINDKECVLNGLTKETKYYYQICATDVLGNKGCAEGNSNSKTISAPVITSNNTPSTAVNGYLKSQTLNVTYSSANITSPTYYIMSERAGRSNVNVIGSCGTGLEPGTCSAVSTKTIVANTWYKVSGNISVTYDVTNATTKQYLYGRTTDGKNIATGNYEISKIDNKGPINVTGTVTNAWSNKNKTITASATDEHNGTIAGYYISTSNATNPSASAAEWQTAATFSKGAGTYYVWAKDSLGNVSSPSSAIVVTNIETTAPTIDVTVANATTYAKTKTATITISDTTSGLKAGTYTIRYGWGTPSNPDTILCSSLGATTTITVDTTGTKSVTKDVTVPNRTGEGKIFVCNSTAIKDDAGNSLSIDSKDYATMYLDNTGPTVTASSSPEGWTSTNKTITASASDANVGTVAGYYISNNTTKPSATAAGWQTGNKFVKGNGTYYVWAKDSLGNVSATYATVTVTNIDTANPTTVVLSANNDTAYTKTKSVTVTLKDTGGSGLVAGKFKYGWSTSNSTQPSSYTEVSTSATSGTNTTTFKANGSGLTGSYYLWVVPVTYKDNAGRSNTTTVKSTGTFKFDNLGPVVTLSSATVTSNSITVPYTSVDANVGTIGSTTCVYGTSTSYGSNGTVSGGKCVMSGLSAATTYYYKITSTDSLGNSTTNSVKTGSAKTTTSISGTPTITAAWPSTTQIKTTVSGVTSTGDTVSYRYSLNGTVKQDWSTSNTYTYTGLSGGKSYTIKVETKTTNSGITGNSKEATIYTSKVVTGTTEYTSSTSCSNGSYSISATTVYNGTTLKSPSCSSSSKLVYSNTCNTSYSTTSSCPSTRSCTVGGYTDDVSYISHTPEISYGDWSDPVINDNLSSCSTSNSKNCSNCTSYVSCDPKTLYTKKVYNRSTYYTKTRCDRSRLVNKLVYTRTSSTVYETSGGAYTSSTKRGCCTNGYNYCIDSARSTCSSQCGSSSNSCYTGCYSEEAASCNNTWAGGVSCTQCKAYTTYGSWTQTDKVEDVLQSSCTTQNSSSCASCTSYTACVFKGNYTEYTCTNSTVSSLCSSSGGELYNEKCTTGYTDWSLSSANANLASCTSQNSSSCSSCTSYTECAPQNLFTKKTYTREKIETNNCNYSGTVNGYSTVYNGSFSGVVTPKQTTY